MRSILHTLSLPVLLLASLTSIWIWKSSKPKEPQPEQQEPEAKEPERQGYRKYRRSVVLKYQHDPQYIVRVGKAHQLLCQVNQGQANQGFSITVHYLDFYDDHVYVSSTSIQALPHEEAQHWQLYDDGWYEGTLGGGDDAQSFYYLKERIEQCMYKLAAYESRHHPALPPGTKEAQQATLMRMDQLHKLFSPVGFHRSPLWFPAVWSPSALALLIGFLYGLLVEIWPGEKGIDNAQRTLEAWAKAADINSRDLKHIFRTFRALRRVRNSLLHFCDLNSPINYKMAFVNLGFLDADRSEHHILKHVSMEGQDYRDWLQDERVDFNEQKLEKIKSDPEIWKAIFRSFGDAMSRFCDFVDKLVQRSLP